MNQRDRDLAISRGLGKALVTTGVVGSLGFAALAALSTASSSTGAPAPSLHARGSGVVRQSGRAGTAEGGLAEPGDDDQPVRPQRNQLSPVAPAPRLQLGSGGTPQATTAGS